MRIARLQNAPKTLRKTNIAHEKKLRLGDSFPFGNAYFQGLCILVLGRVLLIFMSTVFKHPKSHPMMGAVMVFQQPTRSAKTQKNRILKGVLLLRLEALFACNYVWWISATFQGTF